MQSRHSEKGLLQWLNGRWQGELPDGRFIWMSDAIFQEYANAWAMKHLAHGAQPTEEQLWDARQHCRQLSFWVDISDGRIYVEPRPKQR